jgi:hypothetical protein
MEDRCAGAGLVREPKFVGVALRFPAERAGEPSTVQWLQQMTDSALFNEATLDDSGAVQRLDHHSEPGEFGTLVPPGYPETPGQSLRLWIFDVQPAAS